MLEFLKQPGVYECVLVMAGIFIHKIMTSVLGVIHMYKYYRELGHSSFTIIVATYLMALSGLSLKEKYLRETGLMDKQIEIELASDQRELVQWKNTNLQGLYTFAPSIFREIQEELEKESKLK